MDQLTKEETSYFQIIFYINNLRFVNISLNLIFLVGQKICDCHDIIKQEFCKDFHHNKEVHFLYY